MVREFVDTHPNACVFKSLGQLRYFSCLAQVDGVVGNSSSGLLEAPLFMSARSTSETAKKVAWQRAA